eukprot:EG_transcript_40527
MGDCSDPPFDFDAADVMAIVGPIRDPELPFSLEQLGVVEEARIAVAVERRPGPGFPSGYGTVSISLRPTVPHCSFVQHIALCIHARLRALLPPAIGWKVDLRLEPGSHLQQGATERQINDKERVAAALECPTIWPEVERCIN